ncbi:uncharacterized protein LOC143193556 isoform X4 [Rhynchophorus ferrugineus]|uniref:uncharacterized protein LOC143193556 isoform X4 n=1 Tax=Rhynchophorus ferrugineus TaxID=354439 RepID=UPI003FCDFD79
MKTKKHRTRNVPNPVARAISQYEPPFKKAIISHQEKTTGTPAIKHYTTTENTIKRWRKVSPQYIEKSQPTVRRSKRNASNSSTQSTNSKDAIQEIKTEYVKPDTDLDSMPLQQRLSQNTSQCTSNNSVDLEPPQSNEPVLQSQPISPTKLKVTRQSVKPHIHNTKTSSSAIPIDKVCLKWDSHHTNMQSAFPSLLLKEQYVDATLVSEGKTLKCHRIILSSCSPYFEEVLSGISPLQHPVLFMKDIPFWILKALCDFMYAGEVHILQEHLQDLITAANALKIKGLAMSKDNQEEVKQFVPIEIKQEKDVMPILPIKKEENTMRSTREEKHYKDDIKQDLKQEVRSKRREDRKTKYQSQIIKEALAEDTPRRLMPKLPQKMVQKVCNSKSSVKNVSKASTSRTNREGSKRNEKHKQENVMQKEKEKEKPLKKNEHINDPLDLLEPVYEEIAKEEPPLPPKTSTKNLNPARFKENKGLALKKGIKKTKEETTRKKVKKRRYAEYNQDRDESPSPTFQSRKGTRSRPNVKIPKFFHTSYEDSPKETTDATIVRVPHTDQNDPLIEADMSAIKAEPLDMEESTIEVEDNIVNYITPEMTSHECEEIIGSYDSPIVNIPRAAKRNAANYFKKMGDPVIMDVHTVTESEQSDVSLMNISNETVEIIDVADITSQQSQLEDTMDRTNCDPLSTLSDKTSSIKISNVQTVTEDPNSKKDDFFEATEQELSETVENNSYIQETEEITESLEQLDESSNTFENSMESLHISENEENDIDESIESTSVGMNFKIESVVSQSQDLSEKISDYKGTSSNEHNQVENNYSESIGNTSSEIQENQINLHTDDQCSSHLKDINTKKSGKNILNLKESDDLETVKSHTKESESEFNLRKRENYCGNYNENESIPTNFENKDLTANNQQKINDQSSQMITLSTELLDYQKCVDSDKDSVKRQNSINKQDNAPSKGNIDQDLHKSLASTSAIDNENVLSNDVTTYGPNNINDPKSNISSDDIVQKMNLDSDILTKKINMASTSESGVTISLITNCIEKADIPNTDIILPNVTDSFLNIVRDTQHNNDGKDGQNLLADCNSKNVSDPDEKTLDRFDIPEIADFVNLSASSPLQSNFIEENLLAQSPQTDLALPLDSADNNQLEESLLELEDDVITSNVQPVQDNTEKTLEMIVNDLNESLGTVTENIKE